MITFPLFTDKLFVGMGGFFFTCRTDGYRT
jgi:hypothetical protein